MNRINRNKILLGLIGIIVIIVVFVILYANLSGIRFATVMLGIVLILFILYKIGPAIIGEIKNRQVSVIKKEEKYIICPKCKELIDKETGVCSSCGYKD